MPRSSAQPSGRPPRVHVDQIGTAPMTSQQRQQAITALATLIATWQQDQDTDAEQADPGFATPLPLPGIQSDTDHAA
jgi:hypothetical protein